MNLPKLFVNTAGKFKCLKFEENYTVSTSHIIIMVNLNAQTPLSLNIQLTNQNPFWYVQ
jgi:hypothetical protein